MKKKKNKNKNRNKSRVREKFCKARKKFGLNFGNVFAGEKWFCVSRHVLSGEIKRKSLKSNTSRGFATGMHLAGKREQAFISYKPMCAFLFSAKNTLYEIPIESLRDRFS